MNASSKDKRRVVCSLACERVFVEKYKRVIASQACTRNISERSVERRVEGRLQAEGWKRRSEPERDQSRGDHFATTITTTFSSPQ